MQFTPQSTTSEMQIDLTFKDFTYMKIEQKAAFPAESLFGYFGGTLVFCACKLKKSLGTEMALVPSIN